MDINSLLNTNADSTPADAGERRPFRASPIQNLEDALNSVVEFVKEYEDALPWKQSILDTFSEVLPAEGQEVVTRWSVQDFDTRRQILDRIKTSAESARKSGLSTSERATGKFFFSGRIVPLEVVIHGLPIKHYNGPSHSWFNDALTNWMLVEARNSHVASGKKDAHSTFQSILANVKKTTPNPGNIAPSSPGQKLGHDAMVRACDRSFRQVTASEWNKRAPQTQRVLVSLAHVTYGRLKTVKARKFIPYDLWYLWIPSVKISEDGHVVIRENGREVGVSPNANSLAHVDQGVGSRKQRLYFG